MCDKLIGRFDDKKSGDVAVDSDAFFLGDSVAHAVAELGEELLSAERFVSRVVAPELILRIDFVTGYVATEIVVLAEYDDRVGRGFERSEELGLFGCIREVADGSQKLVTGVCPVEDTRKFRREFLREVNITRFLSRIVGVWVLDILTRKVDELHTAVKTVDDFGSRHSVASVNELTAWDEVDVVETLVTRLDSCSVSDF